MVAIKGVKRKWNSNASISELSRDLTMTSYSELRSLREEEQVLLKMSNMLSDQLKRVQVSLF